MSKIGIYCFTNNINNKKYVGQSKQLERRYYLHIRDSLSKTKQEKDTSLLHAAIRKYGIENFSYEILEECSIEELNSENSFEIKKMRIKNELISIINPN